VLYGYGAADVLQAGRQGRPLRRHGPNRMPMPVTVEPASPLADADLWRTLNARLVAFVSRRIADRHAAEDVAQEVLLRLYRGLDQLRAGDRLDAFAYRIARNAIIDHYRSTASAKELPAAPDDLAEHIDAGAAVADEPEVGAGAQEFAPCLQPLVRRLPAPYREALMLTDLGELSQVEAADVVGLSIPGMKARVQRGRAQLHQLLIRCCDIARDEDRRTTGAQCSGPCACPRAVT
jgi:RNA polymerase sigma-70 factor (ECF subfamily)